VPVVEPEVLEKLAAPLDPARVKYREGRGGRGGQAYLETWDCKATANSVFGFDGWGYTVEELVCIGEETFQGREGKDGYRVGYRATVRVTADGFQDKSDVGYGDSVEYTGSRITPHELAVKEAVSDALKRALTGFGDQWGNVLYNRASSFRTGAQPAQAKPKPVDTQPMRDAVARLGIEQEVAARVQRFVLQGGQLESQEDVTAIVGALEYYAAHPEEAEAQLRKWEVEHAESV
jgi:DNA recombination protein Rad52